MMKRNKKQKYLEIYNVQTLLHAGKWNDLPFTEEIIISKSIAFFDDSCPCYIHQNAVRVRLLAELENSIVNHWSTEWLLLLSEYTGLTPITKVIFSEK